MRTSLIFLFLFLFPCLQGQTNKDPETVYTDFLDQAREKVLAGEHENAWQLTLSAAAVWEYTDPFFGQLEAFEETAAVYTSRDMQQSTGRKDYRTASNYYSFALEKFPGPFKDFAEDEVEYLADINVLLGNACKRTSRILEAKSAYEKALSGYTYLDTLEYDYDRRWVALFVYKPLANIYTRLENYENAAALLLLAQSVLEEEGKAGEAIQASVDLGILYATTGRPQMAIDLFADHENDPDLSDYIKSILLLNKARSLMALSRSEQALEAIQTAILLSEQTGQANSVLMDTYHVLGQLQIQNDRFPEAEKALDKAVDLGTNILPARSRKMAKMYVSFGNLSLSTKQPEVALSFFQKSLNAVLDGIDTSDVSKLPKPKQLYAENTILTALDRKAAAFEMLYENSENTKHLQLALEHLNAAFEVERLLLNTQQHATSKIQFQKQNQSRRATAISFCNRLFKQTADINFITRAFEIAEAGKAAVLKESIRENLALEQLENASELRRSIRETEKALAAVNSELLSKNELDEITFGELNEQKVFLSQKLLTLKKDLQDKHPGYAKLEKEPIIFSTADIQNQLLRSDQEVFVEYFWGNEVLYAFTVEKNKDITLTEIKITEDLLSSIDQYLELFAANNRWNIGANTYQVSALKIWQMLYAPLKIGAFKKVIIVPDGLLCFIPFEALVNDQNANPFFKTLPYLIKTQNIIYGYSGGVLKEQKRAVSKGKTFLFVSPGFANNKQGLPALNDGLLDLGNPVGLKRLSENNATRDLFEQEASQSRIIHLFTHAEANQNGRQPRVFFYDQALPLSEIYALDLSAELVILSACETNLGEMEKGEGVMSLARGFAYAGASSLIASLWKVKNQQTAEIFTGFYNEMNNGSSRSASLRIAKLSFLENSNDIHASPAYWTGFVFIGNDPASSTKGNWSFLIYAGLALMVAGLVIFWKGRR
jgi:CHAT domain-containing protein